MKFLFKKIKKNINLINENNSKEIEEKIWKQSHKTEIQQLVSHQRIFIFL